MYLFSYLLFIWEVLFLIDIPSTPSFGGNINSCSLLWAFWKQKSSQPLVISTRSTSLPLTERGSVRAKLPGGSSRSYPMLPFLSLLHPCTRTGLWPLNAASKGNWRLALCQVRGLALAPHVSLWYPSSWSLSDWVRRLPGSPFAGFSGWP